MDLLTQGLLGASLAQTHARTHEARLATGIGFFSGLIADADILIQSSNDPLLTVEFHRHFTHSIFFVPFGAAIAAILLWPFMRKRMVFPRLYLFCLLGYSLSGVLDALTSYGTHLLWPLSETRLAFNIISVIDPVFTLILLIAVIGTFRQRTAMFARCGLIIVTLYLLFGWVQLQRAESTALMLAQMRGHHVDRLLVKPTLANLLLWRSVYESDNRFYVDAIRVGLLSEPHVYAGESTEKFIMAKHLHQLPENSVLAKDIARFTRFSDGFVTLQPGKPDLLVDVRYSNLPTSVAPLWAIEMDLSSPRRHAEFRVFRHLSKEIREQFLALLMGKNPE
jgi:inner membrane protein